MKPKASNPEKIVSDYGNAVVYTPRHINGCQLRDRHDNSCFCPKWIYHRAKGGKPVQMSAQTPSFAEACVRAKKIVDGFNPEIAKAREVNEPKPGITIEDALGLYEAAMKRRTITPKYVIGCLQPFRRRKQKEYRPRKEHGRARNLSLLDWLDHENLTAREPVVRLAQLTSDHLDRWSADWETNDNSTHLWRARVTQFLEWSRARGYIAVPPEFREPLRVRSGNRCGHFENAQMERMYGAIPFFRMGGNHAMPENFAARMTAFIDCGRHAGMAVMDIIHLNPKVSIGKNNVLVYRRQKNGQVASVLLDAKVAARLRSIPPEKGSDPDRPFRFPGTSKETNTQTWRYRFQALCKSAGITEIETELGKKRAPNPHMLRDTCAIAAIVGGVSIDNVAKLLGHTSTTMTQRSYLFWVKARVDHCIEDQRLALERAAAAQEAEPEPEVERVLVN